MAIPRYPPQFQRFVSPPDPVPVTTVAYGPRPEQRVDVRLPPGDPPHPVAVVIHGGFWQLPWDRTLMNWIADDLSRHGMASWNIEYARVGGRGGWPTTFEDVAAAVDAIADSTAQCGLDAARVAVTGHSAGGHLALWSALRHRVPLGSPGSSPRVRLRGAVSLAGMGDLEEARRRSVGGSAVRMLMGGSAAEVPDRYAAGSPSALLPGGVSLRLVHGQADDVVPAILSTTFSDAAAQAGDDARAELVDGEDHYDAIDPGSGIWNRARAALSECLGTG